ncbi:MAG: dsDNA nuclease domain-containing protein [Chitinophagaceae bacterium]
MEHQQDSNESEFSLLHPMAMGGINGGDGYTFQERYIVCNIPKWLSDPQFMRIMYEGTGDVDVVYKNELKSFYDHIQVKDHNVTPAELKQVVDGFVKIDNGTEKIYRHFILTSLSVSQTVKSLAEALIRYREAEILYAENDREKALRTTKEALLRKIEDLGIKDHTDFILKKLKFEIGKFDFNDNGTCKRMFISTLVEHPKYKENFAHIIAPVYSVLIEQVLAHRGKVFESDKIDILINTVLLNPQKIGKDNVLHFHNWSFEKFDPEATIKLDWSHLFDRDTRLVPDADVWNNELIPQLLTARKDLAKTTTNRHIIFRGKCSLSSCIALGLAFPEVGNWTFELIQPPQTKPWRSDAEKIAGYKFLHKEISTSTDILRIGSEVAIVFSITGKAIPDVSSYFTTSFIPIKKIISIEPKSLPGNFSIQNDSEAVSLASAAKDVIKQMVNKYKATKIHLFYFGPAGLAIFLGQKLTSVGAIQLYEFQDPGYKPSCLLKS